MASVKRLSQAEILPRWRPRAYAVAGLGGAAGPTPSGTTGWNGDYIVALGAVCNCCRGMVREAAPFVPRQRGIRPLECTTVLKPGQHPQPRC